MIWTKKIKYIFLGLISIFLMSCSGNLLSSFADTESDEALLFEAKQALDQKEYDNALSFIALMSTTAQAEETAIELRASARAGLCGFEFLTFVDNISNASSGTLFANLMTAMPNGTATKRDECLASINEIINISGTAASRTENQNMLMAMVGLALIGTILNKDADTDNDDTVDGGYAHCTTSSDADVTSVVVGLANAIESLNEVGSASSFISSDISDLTTLCAALPANLNFCSSTTAGAVTADQIDGMRGLIGSDQSLGLGTCTPAGSDVATCAGQC